MIDINTLRLKSSSCNKEFVIFTRVIIGYHLSIIGDDELTLYAYSQSTPLLLKEADGWDEWDEFVEKVKQLFPEDEC